MSKRSKSIISNPPPNDEGVTDALILEVWKQAWDDSDHDFPFNFDIDEQLNKIGVNAYMLEVRLKMIETKSADTLTPEEVALMVFYSRVKHLSRLNLLNSLKKHPPGQIHLARTIFGLEPNQKHEIKETRKLSDALKDGDTDGAV